MTCSKYFMLWQYFSGMSNCRDLTSDWSLITGINFLHLLILNFNFYFFNSLNTVLCLLKDRLWEINKFNKLCTYQSNNESQLTKSQAIPCCKPYLASLNLKSHCYSPQKYLSCGFPTLYLQPWKIIDNALYILWMMNLTWTETSK